MGTNDWLDDFFLRAHMADYNVKCARCGIDVHVNEAYVEEGDEWECEPCWERCEAKELIARHGLDFDVGT